MWISFLYVYFNVKGFMKVMMLKLRMRICMMVKVLMRIVFD